MRLAVMIGIHIAVIASGGVRVDVSVYFNAGFVIEWVDGLFYLARGKIREKCQR